MNELCKKALRKLLSKNLFVSVSGSGLVLSLVISLASPAWAKPETITFLHTNDLYEISAKGGKGGMGRLAQMLKEERGLAGRRFESFWAHHFL